MAPRAKYRDLDLDAELAEASSWGEGHRESFDRCTRSSIMAVTRPFFTDPDTRGRAFGLSFGVLVALVTENAALLIFSEVQKKYMSALTARHEKEFNDGLRTAIILIAVVLPITGIHAYLNIALETEWRAAVTRRLTRRYLGGGKPNDAGVYYQLHLKSGIDNPDQRICQDVSIVITDGVQLIVDLFGSTIRLVGFAAVLYRISVRLCVGIFFYAMLATLISIFGFGVHIFKYQQMVTQQEASLRYSLIRVRENAESIAFFRGGASEGQRFLAFFSRLVTTIYARSLVLSGFAVFKNGIMWLSFAVPVLTVGPAYMRGEVEFGVVSQVQFAFASILTALTIIMQKLQVISGFAMHLSRLGALDEAITKEEARHASKIFGACTEYISMEEHAGVGQALLEMNHVCLRTPLQEGCSQQTLVEDVSLALTSGQSLLIVGESGIGKSSMLRCIAGLWSDGSGGIRRCESQAIFFMPQRPYMFQGTLQQQLLYPRLMRTDVTPTMLLQALHEVNLGHIAEVHDLQSTRDWASVLSLGEQQRINFARVLLQPGLQLAFIDEGTSACDLISEARLYEALSKRLRSYISVGHRPALRKHHSHALLLERCSKDSADGASLRGWRNMATARFMAMADYERLA